MRKYMMLLGKESFWLLGVAAIAFCVGIIISVDWLTNICWSIVAATIVYGVTVVLSRYSERKYRSIFLRKYVSALLEVGVNLFQNITSKNSSVIPLDVDIEKACIIGQTKCALFTNEMCKKKIFFHAKLKAFNQCLNSV